MNQESEKQSASGHGFLRRAGASFAVACALTLSACGGAGELDAPSGAGNGESESAVVELESLKLASITLANGNEVGWYELAPGTVALRESFRYPTQPVLDLIAANESPTELFQQLSKGIAAPEKLVAAVERSRVLDEADDVSDFEAVDVGANDLQAGTASVQIERTAAIASIVQSGGVPTQVAAVDNACPWSWFKSQCDLCATGPCGDWQISWPYGTGNSSFSKKGYMTTIAICPFVGSVHQLIKLRGKTSRDALRLPGVAVRWFLNNGSHKFTASSTVDQADGDGYHHCGEGTW